MQGVSVYSYELSKIDGEVEKEVYVTTMSSLFR